MLCVTPKIHGALGDSAVAESAPQTFALLPHLSKDPVLQTGSCRCTPNSRLFIMHCHRTGSFPSYTPHPPTTTHHHQHPHSLPHIHRCSCWPYIPSQRSDINQRQWGWLRLSHHPQTTPRCPCPDATPQQRWLGYRAGQAGERMDRQTGEADRHVAMWFQCNFGKHIV